MEEGSNSDGGLTEGSYRAGSSRDHDRSVRRRYDYSLPDDFDRISELPDPILVNILSLLPFTDVIATATLSKRWLFLWKMVSNLVFSKSDRSRTSALVSFIDRALLLHECSRINKFSVGFYYCSTYGSAVDVWLRLATGKNVEEIDLGLEPSDIMCRYTLPQHLYTSSSLVKLTLTYCSMRPIAVVSWPSLKTLSIDDDPELNDNLIESILSGCPALESLELSHCSGVTKLNITSASLKKLVMHSWSILQVSAPNVESLSILGRRYAKVISLKLPSLLCATLSFQFLTWPHDFLDYNSVLQRLMMNLLETLNHVEELTIGNRCIQVLSLFEVKNLTAPMSMRKCLILNISSSRWNYPGIANLLRSSVSLETLVINMNRPGQNEIVLEWEDTFRKIFEFYGKLDDKYWNSQEGSLVNSLQCLKTVKIIDSFTDSFIDQMQIELLLGLLQVILKNCRVLEKVVIWTNNDADHEKSLNSMEVAQRLSSFHRASTSAVILSYNC